MILSEPLDEREITKLHTRYHQLHEAGKEILEVARTGWPRQAVSFEYLKHSLAPLLEEDI